MPVTITVHGHEGVITSLRELSDKLKGPETVNALGQMTATEMRGTAPVGKRGDAGKLKRTVSERAGPERTGQGWWTGVGNLKGIYPTKPAPRHTIKNFLEMIRGKVTKTSSKPKKAGTRFNPKKAWHYLSDEEKDQLRAMREAGIEAVGGTSPYRPFYWWIQEVGAEEVGIRGQHYVEKAVNRIRSRIDDTVIRVLREILVTNV